MIDLSYHVLTTPLLQIDHLFHGRSQAFQSLQLPITEFRDKDLSGFATAPNPGFQTATFGIIRKPLLVSQSALSSYISGNSLAHFGNCFQDASAYLSIVVLQS